MYLTPASVGTPTLTITTTTVLHCTSKSSHFLSNRYNLLGRQSCVSIRSQKSVLKEHNVYINVFFTSTQVYTFRSNWNTSLK